MTKTVNQNEGVSQTGNKGFTPLWETLTSLRKSLAFCKRFGKLVFQTTVSLCSEADIRISDGIQQCLYDKSPVCHQRLLFDTI